MSAPNKLGWLIPRQKVLFGLTIFLFASFFIRTFFFVANSPARIHELQKLLPTVGLLQKETRKLDQQQKKELLVKAVAELAPKLVPKFVQFKQNFKLAQNNQIEMCVVEGNSVDFLTATMCYIHDPKKYKDEKRTIYTETLNNRFCKDKNEADKFHETPKQSNKTEDDQKWVHLAVVRDPIERFVSSFHRLCHKNSTLCGSCANNFTCFLRLENERANEYAKNPSAFKPNEADVEFFPQNWHCNFSSYLKNYTLLRIESKDEGSAKLLNDLFFNFREQKVNNDDMSFLYKQINERPQTDDSRILEEAVLESKLRMDTEAMQLLVQLYHHDFQLFGFEMPYMDTRV
ncbi:hypothetical protein M3Y97_00635100 [Aphelenchoides bicaudatus]|nr:hypothetical protein M3Y97_00635100 [Aphelenchoides bicaudatus]